MKYLTENNWLFHIYHVNLSHIDLMIKPTEITFVEENSSFLRSLWDFLSGSEVKNPHAKAGDTRDVGSVPGLGRYPGGGNGNPLQFPCLGSPRDREA